MEENNLNYQKQIDYNRDKYHYFIGNILNNFEQINVLKKIRKILKKKYYLKDYHWNNLFSTNLIYLGFLDQNTANIYMQNIISNLLSVLSNDFKPLKCNYTGYKISYDKSYYKISLNYNDKDNYIEKIIIPYLHENAIAPIYNKRKINPFPAIDLINFKSSSILSSNKDKINLFIPKEEFIIDNLSLIKGTPLKIRKGLPSVHDQMNLEEVYKYKFPFKKNNNEVIE